MVLPKDRDTASEKTTGKLLSSMVDRAKKALEQTAIQAEKTGRRALKFTEEVAESVSHSAENAVQKIKHLAQQETTPSQEEKSARKPLRFPTRDGLEVEAQVAALSEEISSYLEKNGPSALDKVVNTMQRHRKSQPLIFCAIGWLLQKKKITIGADHATLAVKQEARPS